VSGPAKPDVDLVLRAQQGDRAAFAELFESLHRPVLGYVFHLVGDTPTAEDIAQDAFVRAHQRLGQLGPPYDFKSWVYRIAGNLAMDHLRGSRRIVDLEEPLPMGEPPTTRRPLERKVQRDETRRSVQETLAGLPPAYRQALVLREINGLSYDEVAQALETTYENARQLVHRARMSFRELHGLKVAVSAGAVCRELGDLLSAEHDGELPPESRRAVRSHIASCRECRETQRDLKKVAALLAALPPIIPSPAWKSSVLGRIGAPPPPAPPPAAPLAAWGGWGVAAVTAPLVAAGILAGALYLRRASLPGLPPPISTETATVAPATASESPPAPLPPLAPTPTPVSTSAISPTAPVEPTLGPPFVTAMQLSNCRFGPGLVFEPSDYLDVGETAPIDGRNGSTTWWWIRDGDGRCWVWGGNVEVGGDTSGVPVIPDPPTPTPVDEIAPVVSVSHTPALAGRPSDLDAITFTATASDNARVARIEIWLRAPGETAATLRRTCVDATSCVITLGPLAAGQGTYFARAWDPAGNQRETTPASLTVYVSLQ
jgi:RNA polymerase sigma factor (sigma-70 family)